jgi:hypothetical protein
MHVLSIKPVFTSILFYMEFVMKYLFSILILVLLRCGYPEEYVHKNADTETGIYGVEVFLEKEKITEGEITTAHLRIILPDGEKEDADKEGIEWISEKNEIASVDKSGTITGQGKGFSSITAYYDQFSSSILIEVEEYIDCSRIVISEVFYDASGSDTGVEFLEIQNRNENRCDLSGFSIIDGYSGSSIFFLPEKSFIMPGGFLLVVQDPEKFTQHFGLEPDIEGLDFSLNNSGETLTLADPDMTVVDRIYIEGGYGSDPLPESWGDTTLPSASAGESVQRKATPDTDTYNDWFSGLPTPGL